MVFIWYNFHLEVRKLAREILKDADVPKDSYENAQGKMIEITHVEVSVNKANKFVNQKGIDNLFAFNLYDKEDVMEKGWIKG